MALFRQATAIGLIVAGFLLFGASFTSYPGCDWSEQTSPFCNDGQDGKVAVDTVVGFESCPVPASTFWLGSSFQYGLPTNQKPSDNCKSYGCDGCVKSSYHCKDGQADTDPKFECVGGHPTQDVRPLAIFVYLGFITLGVVLLVGLWEPSDLVLIALIVIAVGAWWTERSIEIVASCDQSDVTGSCSDGSGGKVQVTTRVTKTLNANPQGLLGPFATNVMQAQQPLLYGCKPLSCLVASTSCKTSVTTYTCEGGQSVSYAAPVNLFFGMIIIVAGILIAVFSCCHKGSAEREPLVQNSH